MKTSINTQDMSPEAVMQRLEARRLEVLKDDQDLTAEQLDDKYNPEGDGRHPIFGEESWMLEVMNRQTLVGYWDWVVHEIEEALSE